LHHQFRHSDRYARHLDGYYLAREHVLLAGPTQVDRWDDLPALVTQHIGGARIVPDASSFAIAGLGALAFLGCGLRRRKAQGA
jgi:hypothetical protein